MSGHVSLDIDTEGRVTIGEWTDTATRHAGSKDHLALIYSDPAEQLATVAAYIRDGIARNERCVYVADDNRTERVRTALEQAGIDVEAALDTGSLSLYTAEDTYLRTGSFDRSATIEFWTDALSRAQQDGFDGLRAATEMTWALDAEADLESVVSYERTVNEHYDWAEYTVLCQYNRDRFPRETIEAVDRSHPLLVEDGAVEANDRYRPVRLSPDPDGSGDHRGRANLAQDRDREALGALTASTDESSSDAPVRVLLVDDDSGYAEMVSEYLEGSDAVDVAAPETDPRQAVARLEDDSFDCVVSDYEMPGLDGLDLLKLVRENHPDLPFLMLTAKGDEATAVDAISAGVTDYFRKRGGTDQYATLAHRISSVVSQYRAERDAAATRRQYTRLVEESTDVVVVLDECWRIKYLSPAAERRFGYPPGALVRDVVFEHIHPADRDAALTRFTAVTDDSRGSVAAEFRVRHRDGSWLWVEARGRNLLDDPDIRGVVVHLRDVSERKERQRELRESERRFRSLFEGSFDAMVLTDEGGRCVDANPAACDLFDLPCDQLTDRSLVDFVPDDHGASWLRCDVQSHDQTRTTVPLQTATGTRRVVEVATTPNVVPGRHLFVLRDVTDRTRHKQALAALHDSSREFLIAESRTDVTATFVDAATNVLSMSVVAVYLFDDGMLAPAAVSDDTVDISALNVLAPGLDNAVGAAFVDGETRSVQAGTTEPPLDDLPLRDGIVVPLGDHGACVVGDADPGLSDTDVNLVETLAATTRTALDRVDQEAELRDQTTKLRSQSERLGQARELNTATNKIANAITQADTRADIERVVCRHLSTVRGVAFVRIDGYDQIEDCLVPRESEGDSPVGEWPAGPATVDDSTDPAARAVVTEEPVYVPNTAEDVQAESWRRSALANGLRSVVSLPLTYQHITYGTLTVYAEQTGFFNKLVRLALVDLSHTVASVMNAVEQQHATLADTMIEATVRFTDERIPLYYLTSRLDCTLVLEAVVPQSGGETLERVRVTDGDPATVVGAATEIPTVSDATITTDGDRSDVVELRCTNKPLTDYLADRGVRVLESISDPESATFTLAVPDTVDIRSLLESMAVRYGDPTLVAKSEQEAAVDSHRRPDAGLTPRQREVVRTAHAEGFFESPRGCAAEDVAEELGISPQTFYRHIRTAERKLFDAVFNSGGE